MLLFVVLCWHHSGQLPAVAPIFVDDPSHFWYDSIRKKKGRRPSKQDQHPEWFPPQKSLTSSENCTLLHKHASSVVATAFVTVTIIIIIITIVIITIITIIIFIIATFSFVAVVTLVSNFIVLLMFVATVSCY